VTSQPGDLTDRAIVPRWEWRTFGGDLGGADGRLRALPLESSEDRDEVYVLSLKSEASVKAREGRIDVKHLQHVDADGLEQWKPVLELPFPVAADGVRALIEALGATVPTPARSEYALDELVDDVIRPSPDLLAVAVHKHRRHYTLGGCMAELSELRAGSATRTTIAVESEDPARVSAVVRELGLAARPNVNVPRELKALLGFGSRRYAALDVGTNSVKLQVAERDAAGEWRTVVDRAEVTRLGQGLDAAGSFDPKAVERTVQAITAMAVEAREAGAAEIAAVGTAGLRLAADGAKLVEAVRGRAGVEIEVISGEEESRLAYHAATSGLVLGPGPVVVFDTGGGSSQFTFGHGDRVDERFSVDVGAARLTERRGLDGMVGDDALAATLDAIDSDLARLDGRERPDTLVGMGGAVTNLVAVKLGLAAYDPDLVHGAVLDRAEVDRQIDVYRTLSADERRGIVGLQPDRAEVILAGACVVRTVLAKLGRESLTASDRGLRHGLLQERFGVEVGAA
jgi:exopolyphosphatase/guanosine-5'-triphosphate,3'-diphosphate pyrophosphatase